ncbi:caspase family protein [Capilliphycus salinus ALCB114379]|uniref:caspase family protein n=1 Tax=Capilliphycus salinus TaxID=2768948 RepID=UPI0039A57AA6
MTCNIYALLVGIDQYPPDTVCCLEGCVNDITAFADYLSERIAKPEEGYQIHLKILRDEQATRQAIIDGFQNYLSQAESNDIALFYYSGHGAQEQSPEEFWELEADRLDETLICYDSRTEGGYDLADKELAYLISQVAQKEPHIVIMLDCCHSGSGTRGLSPEMNVRRGSVDCRKRPFNTFIFAENQAALNQILSDSQNPKTKITGVVLPKGKHILLSACREYENAKEYKTETGEYRGAFSHFLLQTLQRTNGNITYRDLARNLNALVTGKVKDQSPQVEATNREELKRLFLSGAIKERPHYFTLTHSQNERSWVIDGGSIHGIPKAYSEGIETQLALFPFGSSAERMQQLSEALGEARVTQVLPQRSKVEIIKGLDELSETESYCAVITSLPLPPLKVYIKGDERERLGVEKAQQALLKSAVGNKPSLYVQQVDDPQEADYHLLVKNGQYWIVQPDNNRPLVAPIPQRYIQQEYTDQIALQVIYRLEHIARWNNILNLSTPATSRIKNSDIDLEIILISGEQKSLSSNKNNRSSSEMRVEYSSENDRWQEPRLQIKLTNKSNNPLYCNLINLSESFAVDTPFFETVSSILLGSENSETPSSITSDDIIFQVPDDYFEQGITEYKDILKLIVSTAEFDASLLRQDGLAPPQLTRSVQGIQGTLNHLMREVNTREAVRDKGNYDDWMTKEVTITIVRPQQAESLYSHKNTILQKRAVEILAHSTLKALVNLSTIPQASRDLGNLILPAILRQESGLSQSFQFTNSRGSDPGLSILELSEVEDYTVVSSENPLKLRVNQPLAENESILAFAYDGEFFLPLGRGTKTENDTIEISLERLPKPTASNRCADGSIKIFFEKIVDQKLPLSEEYPILALADFNEQGHVKYEQNLERVKARVAESKDIILCIHGIINDSSTMVYSLRKATVNLNGENRPLAELYDLILTFDSDNFQTSIEENARLLGQKLHEVGLIKNHGKRLDIVAHSTGGLISRWFVEREGGNQVVQHLVLLGTPNGGISWTTIQDWAYITLGLGLNQLSRQVWPTKIVAEFLEVLPANNHLFEQIQPNSIFLQQLANSPDPHVHYTIIAGNFSILSKALEVEPHQQSCLLDRLVNNLFENAQNRVFDRSVFTQENDIVVTQISIQNISLNRSPPPKILTDTACDHFTYFTDRAGREALAAALYPKSTTNHQITNNSKKILWIIGMIILSGFVIGLIIFWTRSSEKQQPNQNSSGHFYEQGDFTLI